MSHISMLNNNNINNNNSVNNNQGINFVVIDEI